MKIREPIGHVVGVLHSGAKRWLRPQRRGCTKLCALVVVIVLSLSPFIVLFIRLGPPSPINDCWKWFRPVTVIPDLDPFDNSSMSLVSFDAESACDGRRLGNQLFTVAALLYAARLTGRTAVLPDRSVWKCMTEFDENFILASGTNPVVLSDDVTVIGRTLRFDESTQSTVLCPCFRFTERLPMAYDEQIKHLPDMTNSGSNRTLLLFGYFQSWRYVDVVADSVRRALVFAPEVVQAATKYLADVMPPLPPATSSGVDRRLVRVGIHVRRGDMASLPVHIQNGYEPPGAEFYRRAIDYFVQRHGRLQFVVCSDELDWTQQNIRAPENATTLPGGSERLINVTYCPRDRSAGHDLAVLSMCDHTIVSAGTFGWWAAWLANGTTVYFDNWPRHGTKLDKMFNRHDYYPPHWIPIGE